MLFDFLIFSILLIKKIKHMKRSNLFYAIVLSIVFAFTYTSCNEDPVIPDEKTPPTVSLVSGDSYISSDAQVDPGVLVTVKVKAVKGTGELRSLAIYENGTLLDIENRLKENSNPISLSADEYKNGFEKEIQFLSQEEGVSDYLFVLTDEYQLSDSVGFTLTLNPQETPLNFSKDSIYVYNADGKHYGSLDLQKGEAVSSKSEDGDVQDVGIDLNNGNWYKKIKPKNGAEMVLPAEGVKFEEINTLEALTAAYDNGTVADVADVVEGNVYLFKTKAVNGKRDIFILKNIEVHDEAANNSDYYLFNLKGYKYE